MQRMVIEIKFPGASPNKIASVIRLEVKGVVTPEKRPQKIK